MFYSDSCYFFFFFQAEDGIRDKLVTGVQTCALPISHGGRPRPPARGGGPHRLRARGLRRVRGACPRGGARAAPVPGGDPRQQPSGRRRADRDRDRRGRPRAGLRAAGAARAGPRRASARCGAGPPARRAHRARRHAPLHRLGGQPLRYLKIAGAWAAHRAAEGRPRGVARGLHGDPRRLPRPGRRLRPGTVAAVHGVFTAEEMRRLDRRAITELGIPGATLMENAGRGAAARIVALLGRLKATRRGARVAVVCGKGGNGGDGFVVARWLKRSGVRPDVLLAFPEGEIGGDAGGKLRELRRSGVRPWLVEDAHAAAEALARADVIVDALLGTGSRGAPEGRVARLIELINASGRPVAALDVPSGVSADGDPPAGPAIRATLTLTFGGFKRGLVCGPGAALAGRVEVVPIGIPAGEVLRGLDRKSACRERV